MLQTQTVEILISGKDNRLDRGLNEMRVNEGLVLYVEEESEGLMTKWEEEFEMEANRFQINYNPLIYSTLQYSNSVLIDRRSTVF
jgi:hypothetical protein